MDICLGSRKNEHHNVTEIGQLVLAISKLRVSLYISMYNGMLNLNAALLERGKLVLQHDQIIIYEKVDLECFK